MQNEFYDAKILIVDDQEANVEVLRGLLELKGYTQVFATTDAREVMKLVNDVQPDLLLLDLMMPHLSGFDIMAQLNASGKMNGLMPIMVLTADANIDSKQRALSIGASDFLTKPFALFEVDLRIRNLLYNVQLLRALHVHNNDLEAIISHRTEDLERVNNEILVSEKKYRMLFESNLDSITICTIDEDKGVSSIIDCNEGAVNMFGYKKNELLKMHMGQVEMANQNVHSDKIDQLKKLGSLAYETSYRNSRGELRFMEAKVVRIELQGSIFAMHIASDITEKKAQIEAIQSQNQALKEIAWQQSHLFRAPVAKMKGIIDLLKISETADPEYSDYLEWLYISAEELDQLIKDITKKVEASKQKV